MGAGLCVGLGVGLGVGRVWGRAVGLGVVGEALGGVEEAILGERPMLTISSK